MCINEKLQEVIEDMSTSDLVSLWNEYTNESGRMDDYIYSMDEFDEVMEGYKPWEVARAAYYSGKFCPAHDYFWFNGYANLESSDFPSESDSPIYIKELVTFIIENENALYNDEVQEILDSMEGEEE